MRLPKALPATRRAVPVIIPVFVMCLPGTDPVLSEPSGAAASGAETYIPGDPHGHLYVCPWGLLGQGAPLQRPLAGSELCGLTPSHPRRALGWGSAVPLGLALLCPQTAVRSDPGEVVNLFLLPASFLWIQLMKLRKEGLT